MNACMQLKNSAKELLVTSFVSGMAVEFARKVIVKKVRWSMAAVLFVTTPQCVTLWRRMTYMVPPQIPKIHAPDTWIECAIRECEKKGVKWLCIPEPNQASNDKLEIELPNDELPNDELPNDDSMEDSMDDTGLHVANS